MPKCQKCYGYFPPEFCIDKSDTAKVCYFCENNVNTIVYGPNNERKATRQEIIKDYEIAIKMIKDSNEEIKKTLKTGKFPTKIIT